MVLRSAVIRRPSTQRGAIRLCVAIRSVAIHSVGEIQLEGIVAVKDRGPVVQEVCMPPRELEINLRISGQEIGAGLVR